jgi:hypothetical protein
MKLVINILLTLLVFFLGYLLFNSIKEPITFKTEKDKRADAVKNRLKDIRTSQELYRDITGEFAPTFDTLKQVLVSDSFKIENIQSDPAFPDDPDKFITEVTFKSALDSINKLNINLDSLRYIPYTGNAKQFKIEADTLTYQKTIVNVLQVSTQWKEFMGPYASAKFSKYDNSYEPDAMFKFGDMGKPNLGGNWPQ